MAAAHPHKNQPSQKPHSIISSKRFRFSMSWHSPKHTAALLLLATTNCLLSWNESSFLSFSTLSVHCCLSIKAVCLSCRSVARLLWDVRVIRASTRLSQPTLLLLCVKWNRAPSSWATNEPCADRPKPLLDLDRAHDVINLKRHGWTADVGEKEGRRHPDGFTTTTLIRDRLEWISGERIV